MKNLKLFALLALVVVSAACGGGSGTSPSDTPPPVPVRSVVRPLDGPGGWIAFPAYSSSFIVDFQIESRGTMDIWFEINPGPPQIPAYVEIFLVPRGQIDACRSTLNCPQRIAYAGDPSLARQVLRLAVSPGSYTVWVVKNGDVATSGRGEIGLTPDV